MMILRLRHHSFLKAWNVPGLLALGGVVSVLAWGHIAPAFAQDRDLTNRINRMENEIQTLSRAVYRGEQPPAGSFSGGGASSANMEVRLQQLEGEMQNLRGLVEQQSYEVRQLRDQLERVTSDIQLRLGDLESGGNASGGAVSGGARGGMQYTTGGGSRGSDKGTDASGNDGYQWGSNNGAPSGQLGTLGNNSGIEGAAAAYENAFSMIKARQYERAQGSFAKFLDDYPDHALAGNAKYWLGETHYVLGDYTQAARIFAEGYQEYPKGSKVADNLLKLGLSLNATGETEKACVALQQLQAENPPGAGPVVRRGEQEQKRIGC